MPLMCFLRASLCLAVFSAVAVFAPVPMQAAPHHVTLVFVPQRELSANEWLAIQSALRANLPSALDANPLIDPNPDIVRVEQIYPGLVVDDVVGVFLEGLCAPLIDLHGGAPAGALGWVYRRHGRIEPFVHIDCKLLVRMLGRSFFGRDRAQQQALLAQAIARVTLHEWLHIASQSPHHRGEGIERGSFSVNNLLAVALRGKEAAVRASSRPTPPRPRNLAPMHPLSPDS
jgi:hypothetical protein